MNNKLYDLTNPQKSILLTEEYYKGSNINNICGTAIVDEVLNFDLLKKAINIVVKNNDSFNLKLVLDNNEIKQYLSTSTDINVEVIDIASKEDIAKIENNLMSHVFDIYNSDLFCFKIFRLPDNTGGFMLNIHHLFADSWTLGLTAREIVRTYSLLVNGEDISKNDDFSYVNYIYSEKEYLNSDKYIKDKEYWNGVFDTIPEQATLPGSKQDISNDFSCKANRQIFNIDVATMAKINEFCKAHNVSVFNFFMAVYAIYIGGVSNLEDFVIGTPILNRTNFKEKNTTGMFINTAPLRVLVDSNLDFKSFVSNIAKDSLSMLRHQKYYYQNILEDLRKKDTKLPNLYNVLVSYQVTKANTENGLSYNTRWAFNGNATDDIDIHLFDLNDAGSIDVAYDYKVAKYEDSDIVDVHMRIMHIVEQILGCDNISLKDIEIVTPEEKKDILYGFNDTDAEYPKDKTVIDLFEEQVEKTPNNIAIVFENQKLTYSELNKRANQLARYLKSIEVKEHDIVSIILPKKPELLISVLAVLKIGACYVPIDSNYPENRIQYILEESKSTLLLTSSDLKYTSDIAVNVDEISNLSMFEASNFNNTINPKNLAYIIYTSGSTGKPKGVTISHNSLINYIYWASCFYCNKQPLNFPLYSSFSFDLTVTSIYTPLITGGSIVIYNDNDILLTLKKIFSDGISDIIKLTPAHLSLVQELDCSCTNITQMIVGGDILPQEICKKITDKFPNVSIYNEYGPTEATVGCMIYKYCPADTKYSSVPIGIPINNVGIYILDKNLNVLPYNCEGEMYIGGDCLSLGYHDSKLDKNKFIKSPFDDTKRLYKTGDLAVLHKENVLEYIGRNDFQVKLNGFRIEIGEITRNTLKFEHIRDCFIDVYDLNDRKMLCGFYVSDDSIDTNALKSFLSNYMPDYMVPKVWTKLDSIPLTINGKVNKKLLPLPNINVDDNVIYPRNDRDISILKHINELLNSNINNLNCNLFEIGFDSLLAIKLALRLSQEYNFNISVKDIFEHSRIQDLSDYIVTFSKSECKNKIKRAKKEAYYPLSSAQKRIYYASSLDANSTLYNTAGGIIIHNSLDIEKVKDCFDILIKRHEALRTHFELRDNDIVQVIDDKIDFDLKIDTATTDDLNDIYVDFVKPFNLSKAPLFRTKLVELNDNKMLLLLDMHHIISDGASLGILLQELCDLYNDAILPEKQIDYKDFTLWEKEQVNTVEFNNSKEYWVNQFKDEIPLLNMPTSYTRPSVQSFEGSNYHTKLSKETFEKINTVAKQLGITPYMLMLSCYYILLSKYTSQDDIVVGTPIVGRNLPELSNVLGMFVNTLALKNKVDSSLSFEKFGEVIKENCINSFKNQEYPFDMLVKDLNIKRDPSRNPLFDVMFVYQNDGYPKINFKDVEVEYFIPDNNIAKFDLTLEIIPIDNEYSLRFEYSTKLFNEDFIQRLSSHYINILNNVLENNEIKIADIDMLSEEEKSQILYDFNDTNMDYPTNKTIANLFEEQVEKTPDNVALVFENEKLTYRELNEKANQLAWYLKNLGIGKSCVVGIMLPRSLEVLVAMLGVLKLGACYIPIDPSLPSNRINYMLSNSKASILLTVQNNVSFDMIKNINISLNNEDIFSGDNSNLNIYTDLDAPSYMIYTSGSTGTPKGVVLNHRALTNLATYLNNTVEFLHDEYANIAMASITTISFDIFIFETLICLQRGLKIVMASEAEQNTPNLLDDLIVRNDVKAIQMTPSRMYIFINNKDLMPHLNNLKYIVLAGEALPKDLLNRILEIGNIKVYNGYGPSETTVFSTFTDVTNYDEITIGKPLGNSRIYILDKNMNPVPIGIPGEIYIAGTGVGIGYANNKEITRERFIQDIFYPSERMYKTGDLGKYLSTGEIHYIGRVDHQIKIRGLRIELDEIENCILKYPNIDKCIISSDIDNNNRQFIVAYLSVTDRISINKLRMFLKTLLPNYMVPSYFIVLDKIPYLNNGKINKNALPKPEVSKSTSEVKTYVAPRNKLELQIATIFQSLLSISPIGIDDNFFELGGDSLLAINLQVELLKLNLNITYSDIFMCPTIRELAKKATSNEVSVFNTIDAKDFSKFNTILDNACLMPKVLEYKDMGNVIITGTTGFLGAHVLDSYLKYETGIAYCFVRPEPGLTLENKFINKLHFFFGNKYDDLVGKRIIIVNSDIAKSNLGLSNEDLQMLSNNISCVINCAAKVSHYGNYNSYKEINVNGTENLIKFCMQFGKRFYHISTLSVSGNSLVDQSYMEQSFEKDVIFKENNFYINQSLDNVYVRSKFEAEKLVLQYILTGLDGYIYRVGNLMNRYEDGKFQPNVDENAYINRLLSLSNIGCIPDYLLNAYMEFTPIDCCAEAIIKLAEHPTTINRVFHLYDNKHVEVIDFINILRKYIPFEIVSNDEFIEKINLMFKQDNSDKLLSGILRDFDANEKLVYESKVKLNCDFTNKYLSKIGFTWPEIDDKYLTKFLDYFCSIGYLIRKEKI